MEISVILDSNTIKWESFYGDPIIFDFSITPDAESAVATFVGGTAEASFYSAEASYAGVASITSALKGHAEFAAGLVPVGTYDLLIRISPPGGPKQTVKKLRWTVNPSPFNP